MAIAFSTMHGGSHTHREFWVTYSEMRSKRTRPCKPALNIICRAASQKSLLQNWLFWDISECVCEKNTQLVLFLVYKCPKTLQRIKYYYKRTGGYGGRIFSTHRRDQICIKNCLQKHLNWNKCLLYTKIYPLPVPVYSVPHTQTRARTHTHTHTHTPYQELHIRPHYQEFIIKTHYSILFYHFSNS